MLFLRAFQDFLSNSLFLSATRTKLVYFALTLGSNHNTSEMAKSNDHKIFALFIAQALILVSPITPAESSKGAEKRIIEYLRTNIRPGEPVIITKLYNEVFTSTEERKVLDRLYNTFFKVPAYVAQYYVTSRRPPSLQEIAHQFN